MRRRELQRMRWWEIITDFPEQTRDSEGLLQRHLVCSCSAPGSQRAGHDSDRTSLQIQICYFPASIPLFSLLFSFCSCCFYSCNLQTWQTLKEEKLKNVYPRKCSDVPVSVKLLLSFEYCILPFVMLDCPSAFLFTRILIHQGWNGSHMSLYCNHLGHHFIYNWYANYFLWKESTL